MVENSDIKSDCLWALFYLGDTNEEALSYLISERSDIVLQVLELLKDKDIDIYIPAMRVFGTILTSNDDTQISYYLDYGLLDGILSLI